jgi:hypothetical protein
MHILFKAKINLDEEAGDAYLCPKGFHLQTLADWSVLQCLHKNICFFLSQKGGIHKGFVFRDAEIFDSRPNHHMTSINLLSTEY